MSDTAYERLRLIFLNTIDLEAEVYNQYESSLSSYGIEFKFYFHPNKHVDFKNFFERFPLWRLLSHSFLHPNSEFIQLRRRLDRPWLIDQDIFNVTLSCGPLVWTIENNTTQRFFYLKELLSKIYLSTDPVSPLPSGMKMPFTVEEFLTIMQKERALKIKLVRIQKESNFRNFFEAVNNFKDEGFRIKLEEEFQRKVNALLEEDSLSDSIVRLQLQERLRLWHKDLPDRPLSAEELKLYYSKISLQSLFPSVLDASLFLNAMTSNSNHEVLDYIEHNPYKQHLLKFLKTLEKQQPLILSFAGENLESWPEFKLRLR